MSDASQTRSSLLRRVRNPADQDGWREFRDLYEPLLERYLRRQGVADADLHDVVQEIFVRLVRDLPRFELDHSRGRFRSWLWRVTRNAVVDWARSRRHWQRAEEAGRRRLLELTPSEGQEPEAEWCDAHHQRVLEFVLERVKARSRPQTWACFAEHVLRGRPGPEVAAELGLSHAAVRKNASTTLARVREESAAYLEELGDA